MPNKCKLFDKKFVIFDICEMRTPRKRRARDVHEKGTKRGLMKKICILFVLVLLSVSVLPAVSSPNYNPNFKPVVWDPTGYNQKLARRLLDNYENKYCKQISPTEGVCNFPEGSYSREVIIPYEYNKIQSRIAAPVREVPPVD